MLFNLILSHGCTEKIGSSDDEGEIYGLFIDSLTMANPYEITAETIIDKEFKDSVNRIPATIMVNPIKTDLSEKEASIISKYDNGILISQKLNVQAKIPESGIESKEGHKIIFGSDLSKYPGKEKQILSFSPIVFNESGNSAAVVVTYSRGRLSFFTNLYFLEKLVTDWLIVDSKSLSRS